MTVLNNYYNNTKQHQLHRHDYCFFGFLMYLQASSLPQGYPTLVSSSQYKKSHNFKVHNYKSPTWCTLCHHFMWGLTQQGCQCQGGSHVYIQYMQCTCMPAAVVGHEETKHPHACPFICWCNLYLSASCCMYSICASEVQVCQDPCMFIVYACVQLHVYIYK